MKSTASLSGGLHGTAVSIPVGHVMLQGELDVPDNASGVILFAHGSGSSRHSPRNQFVARTIRAAGMGTLLFDLLTCEEEAEDALSGHLRFDIALLAARLATVTRWVRKHRTTAHLAAGYFGASTGGAAALVAAAELAPTIRAVVSRGGRPDLAGDALSLVEAPTLLIVGSRDHEVLAMNQDALAQLHCEKHLEIVRGATHLFEEPGTLEVVARLASDWFARHGLAQP